MPKMLHFVAFCCIALHGAFAGAFGWIAKTTAWRAVNKCPGASGAVEALLIQDATPQLAWFLVEPGGFTGVLKACSSRILLSWCEGFVLKSDRG
jgi:hypothetical protein